MPWQALLLRAKLVVQFPRQFVSLVQAAATRSAVEAWGLKLQCKVESKYSPVLTAARVPDGCDADQLRSVILEQCDISLGNGLSRIQGKVFRIGHLGDINDVTLLGTLCGIEMGLHLAAVPHQAGGAQTALDFLKRDSESRPHTV